MRSGFSYMLASKAYEANWKTRRFAATFIASECARALDEYAECSTTHLPQLISHCIQSNGNMQLQSGNGARCAAKRGEGLPFWSSCTPASVENIGRIIWPNLYHTIGDDLSPLRTGFLADLYDIGYILGQQRNIARRC